MQRDYPDHSEWSGYDLPISTPLHTGTYFGEVGVLRLLRPRPRLLPLTYPYPTPNLPLHYPYTTPTLPLTYP